MTDSSPSRSERLAAIRLQIEAGTYETSDKLEAAVERLLDQLPDPADERPEASG